MVSSYTAALSALGVTPDLWDTSNSDTEPASDDLAGYPIVIWFSGAESGSVTGPSAASAVALGTWLEGGGCFVLSSQDYLFARGLTSFANLYLGVSGYAEDVTVSSVTGDGTLFTGLGTRALSFPYTASVDDLAPTAPVVGEADVVLRSGALSTGLSRYTPTWTTVFLTSPFDALATAGDRTEAMGRILDLCSGVTIFGDGVESGDPSRWSFAMAERWNRARQSEGIVASLRRWLLPDVAGLEPSGGGAGSSRRPPRKR